MKFQRIVSIIVVLFFLVIGAATSFSHHTAVGEQEWIVNDIQKLRHRRDALRTKISELEARLKKLDQMVSKHEGNAND